jgi:hypothetical protein
LHPAERRLEHLAEHVQEVHVERDVEQAEVHEPRSDQAVPAVGFGHEEEPVVALPADLLGEHVLAQAESQVHVGHPAAERSQDRGCTISTRRKTATLIAISDMVTSSGWRADQNRARVATSGREALAQSGQWLPTDAWT